MTAEMKDEVPVPHFEDNLWRELARAHDQERVDGSTAVVDLGRRPGRRTVLAGVGAIAAAAALIAGIVITGPNDAADADLEAKIIAATESALADSIEYEVTDWPDTPAQPDLEAWRDQTTAATRLLAYTEDGERSIDSGPVEAPSPDDEGPDPSKLSLDRVVDYCFEEYAVQEVPIPPGATDISSSLAEAVSRHLADGSMHEDGTEVVDGRELIRVIEDSAPDAIWYVDPDTYRPVLGVGAGPDNTAVTTIEYLPRTPENLAQFSPVIPDGFVEVDEPTRSEDVFCS